MHISDGRPNGPWLEKKMIALLSRQEISCCRMRCACMMHLQICQNVPQSKRPKSKRPVFEPKRPCWSKRPQVKRTIIVNGLM